MAADGRLTLILFTFLSLLILTSPLSLAESTPDFEQQLKDYLQSYSFVSIQDTLYTFESEFIKPEGFERIEPSRLTPFAQWVSHFPLWHRWMAVGMWRGSKIMEPEQVSRVIHLPWKGVVYTDEAIPLRVLAEYFIYTGSEQAWTIVPINGEPITYDVWLNGQPGFDSQGKFSFRPVPPREPSEREFYSMLQFCAKYTDYGSLVKNCDSIDASALQPGDLVIGMDESGRKGTVYMIMNILSNKAGDKLYAVATGGVPACDFHIPLFNENRDNPWIDLKTVGQLVSEFPLQGYYRLRIPEVSK